MPSRPPPDDPFQCPSTPLEICVFADHQFLDFVLPYDLFDEAFQGWSFSTDGDVIPAHSYHHVFSSGTTLPHACARDPSPQFELAERGRKLLLPLLLGVARAVQSASQQSAHVLITRLVIQ